MNPLRTLGAWLTSHLIEDGRPDHPAREGRVPPQAPTVDTARLDEIAYANRSLCGLPNHTTDVLYTCTKEPGHDGIHECRIAGPSARLLATWATATGAVTDTPIFDEAQRIQAAKRMATAALDGKAHSRAVELDHDLAARAEITDTANAMKHAGDEAWEFALAGLLDDAEGGEQR